MEYPPLQALTIEVAAGARPDVQIIKLTGPLTVHNFHEFQDLTRRDPRPRVTIVDLTQVPYLDSAALGAFVGIHVACETSGNKYGLVGANERLMDLFDLSAVTEFLQLYDSLDEAEAQLA